MSNKPNLISRINNISDNLSSPGRLVGQKAGDLQVIFTGPTANSLHGDDLSTLMYV